MQHFAGESLRDDNRIVDLWLSLKIKTVDSGACQRKLHPVIQEFQQMIESDPEIHMGFDKMFEQVPIKPPYDRSPTGNPQVRDYLTMLALFNVIISEAPEFENNDYVGFPINAILDWPMSTTAGFATFMNPKVNVMFKKLFDVWTAFLVSPASCQVLTSAENGWFGPAAMRAMPKFEETFVCDLTAPFHGFNSWDDFFTRRFRPGMRPAAFPMDGSVIISSCESTVYNIAFNIKAVDEFWLKGTRYSLDRMFNNDSLSPQFVGGTVYQAYLSALDYHRWHSPVDGTIVKTILVPGTYYAACPAMGFENPDGPDASAATLSQTFLTAVATRALIFIQADNSNIGLMCFMGVGMAEVSTCDITVKVGDIVKKGDQLGMFHFGGSTYCLVFRPQTRVDFKCSINTPVLLNAAIGTVSITTTTGR